MLKIAKSYKFYPQTIELIDRLLDLPEYASATHLLEMLIHERAKAAGIVINGNGQDDPGDRQPKFAGVDS